MNPLALAFGSGLLFGLGLLASGMTDPRKVKAFLDLAGAWDPSLALVMGGAIGVAVFAFARARRGARSWSGELIELHTRRHIDARLIGGAALFGVGWGIAGFCPGPALVALGSASAVSGPALWFVAAMLAGMALHDGWALRRRTVLHPALPDA
ncbi:MAG TPA: DUF6691 family protein [Albitalea sp.]|nr:DUF6691 family protein [Albitalea sp.]